MSTINSKNVQVGTSGVAAQNFTLYQPNTPDGTVRLGVGNSGATTGDVVTVNSAGVTVTGTLTATTLSGSLGAATATSLTVNGNNISAVNSLGFRNRIINGDMRIDQRNAGAATTVTGNGYYSCDRWQTFASQSSKYSVQQNAGAVTPPAGFANYIGITSLSAYSISSTDYFVLLQKIEGFNIADFGWGTANAQSVTVSFWVRSSLTGTFGGAVRNGSGSDRSYPFSYTISSANAWEYKTLTIPGDTTGTWLTTNGVGLHLYFGLGVGATYSGTAGSWQAAGLNSATGATSVVGTNGATFYITGVQLEAGTVASPFERIDYGRQLMMCYRYYFRNTAGSNFSMLGVFGTASGTTAVLGYINLPVTMRSTPSVATSNSRLADGQNGVTISSLSVSQNNTNSPEINFVVTGAVQYRPYYLQANNNTSGYIEYSSEL